MRACYLLILCIFGCATTTPAPLPPGTIAECQACQKRREVKEYHLGRFEKLCLTLSYSFPFVTNKKVKKNIAETLRACKWIYAES